MRYKQVFVALTQVAFLSVTPLSASTRIGDEYLTEGQRAEQAQNYRTALQLYDYAVEEDPRDLAYLAADQRARTLAAEERRNQGRKLIESRNLRAAKIEFQAALRIDPQSKETQEEIGKLEEQIHALPEPVILDAPNDPIGHVQLPRNSAREAYENIARAAGITVTFDSDVIDAPTARGMVPDVAGISVEDALNFAARVTQTSWKTVRRTAIHVSRASQQISAPRRVFSGLAPVTQISAEPKPASFMLSSLPPAERLTAVAQAGKLADVVRLVLHGGAPVNAPNSGGMTALLLAAMGDDPEIVRFLLDHGADPNLSAPAILNAAISHGSIEIVRLLLDGHANPNLSDGDSNTPLDRAVFERKGQIAHLLLAKGANVHEDHWLNGRALIHEVCTNGPAIMIPVLVEFGADPAQQDRFGETPLDVALANKNEDAVAVLLTLARQRKSLQLAAARAMEHSAVRGHTAIAQILLDKGFDINELTEQGSTYLGDAALQRQTGMVNLLLDKGANVRLRSRSGGTALHAAALGGEPAAIDLLLAHGAEIDAREPETRATPLMVAASLNQAQAVAELLKGGANSQLRDQSGRTALDRAREMGSGDTIALLNKSKL